MDGTCICWVNNGDTTVGSIEEFLCFCDGALKFNFSSYGPGHALREKLSDALTASATVEVCRLMGAAVMKISRYFSSSSAGSKNSPRQAALKWRCGPVTRPVLPERPSISPAFMSSPFFTFIFDRCP